MKTETTFGHLLGLCRIQKGLGKKPSDFITRQRKRAELARIEASEGTDTEYPFALIDYRDSNKILKKKMFCHRDAAQRNTILSGSGMAWARIDSL